MSEIFPTKPLRFSPLQEEAGKNIRQIKAIKSLFQQFEWYPFTLILKSTS